MFKKQFNKKTVKVTFYLPESISADNVYLVGDFNGWDEQATPMEKLKDGRFKATVDLEKGREYQFRYLVNGSDWHNDWNADRYVPNPFSGDNSVINTYE